MLLILIMRSKGKFGLIQKKKGKAREEKDLTKATMK